MKVHTGERPMKSLLFISLAVVMVGCGKPAPLCDKRIAGVCFMRSLSREEQIKKFGQSYCSLLLHDECYDAFENGVPHKLTQDEMERIQKELQ